MSSSSESRSTTMFGPRKLFRVVFRIVLFSALTWTLLALLWAFLPSPPVEHNGDNGTDYPTAVLLTGRTLTRVYDSSTFRVQGNHRLGFALDYELDVENLTVDIGAKHVLPITIDYTTPEGYGNFTKQIEVYARIGDTDGANLPWFPFADSVLLYSWVQEDDLNFPVSVQWRVEKNGLARMEVHIAVPRVAGENEDPDEDDNTPQPDNEDSPFKSRYDKHSKSGALLLAVEIQGKDTSTIAVTVPEMPLSSSPSKTYLIRVAIIHIIAPTAIFVSNLLGNAFGSFIESTVIALFVIFVVFIYGFMTLAVIFSLWRCFGGPSFEDTVERSQGRLERLSQNERLQFLKIDVLRENLDLLCRNERFKAAINICRNGWHPERDRARAVEEEEADTEKGLPINSGGEKLERDEDTSSKQ